MRASRASQARPPRSIDVPSRSDPLLRHLSEVVGGPLGKRTAPGRTDPGLFTVERVLVIMTAVAALIAVLGKEHCRAVGWSTPDQQSTGCWSMFPNAFIENDLSTSFPFFSQGSTFDQSMVAGWIAGLAAWLTRSAGEGALRQLAFFDLNAALLAVLWIVVVVLVARTAGRRPWDAAIVASSPVLILTAFVSWDLWAAGLVTVALYFFTRKKTLWAGVFFGLAALAASYVVVILMAILFLGFRAGKPTEMLEMLVTAIISWVLALAPFMAQNPQAFPDYVKKLLAAKATESSLYGGWNLVAERLGLPQLGLEMTNALAAILLMAVLLGVAWLAFRASRTPRVAQLAFLAAAGFLVVSKGTQPWHAVWLVPLLALALPRWRPVLLWQAAAMTHFIASLLFQSKVLGGIGNQHAIDMTYFVLATCLAGAAGCALIILVLRDIYVPAHDVVRRGRVCDPQAGVLQGPPTDSPQSLESTTASVRHDRASGVPRD